MQQSKIQMLNPPRMLTVREGAKVGPLSEYTLRLMLKQGKLPGVYVGRSGKKFLVNHDRLCDMLNGSTETQAGGRV